MIADFLFITLPHNRADPSTLFILSKVEGLRAGDDGPSTIRPFDKLRTGRLMAGQCPHDG